MAAFDDIDWIYDKSFLKSVNSSVLESFYANILLLFWLFLFFKVFNWFNGILALLDNKLIFSEWYEFGFY